MFRVVVIVFGLIATIVARAQPVPPPPNELSTRKSPMELPDREVPTPACGVPGRPICPPAPPPSSWIRCSVDYAYTRSTASGDETISYSEAQQWIIFNEEHVCPADATKRCH